MITHFWLKSMLSHYRSHFSSLSKVWHKGHRISFFIFCIFLFVSLPSLTDQMPYHPLRTMLNTSPSIGINLPFSAPNIVCLYHHLPKSSKMLDFLWPYSKNPLYKMQSSPPCMARVQKRSYNHLKSIQDLFWKILENLLSG